MINNEYIEIQCKILNKIIKLKNQKLYDMKLYNKLCFLIYKNDKDVINYMESINKINNIIYMSIEYKNYKKALRCSCYLEKLINELIKKIDKE